MNDIQIELIQVSFVKVVFIKEVVVEIFYVDLFEIVLYVVFYFLKIDLKEQGVKLMVIFGVVVNGLCDLDKIVLVVQDFVVCYVDYGVKFEDYDFVGVLFLWMLEKGLGDDFIVDVQVVWVEVYGVFLFVMK